MAGFFGLFDYTKEGPGIDKDDLPKSDSAIFLSVLGRRFWKFISLNLMYVLFSIPIIIFSYFLSSFLLAFLFPTLNINDLSEKLLINTAGLDEDFAYQLAGRTIFLIQVIFTACNMSFLYHVIGPVQAGFTYIFRNYARDEHAFLWMDFKDAFVKNFRQSIVCSIISILLNFLFVFSLAFYRNQFNNYWLRTIVTVILIIVFFYFSSMNMYLYQMMVTFNLSIKHLYKNASLFTILRLPFNILLILANLLIFVGVPAFLFMVVPSIDLLFLITVFWYVCFAFSLNYFIQNFYVNKQIKRYMLSRLEESQPTDDRLNLENNGSDDGLS